MSALRQSLNVTNVLADSLRFRDLSNNLLWLNEKGLVTNANPAISQDLILMGYLDASEAFIHNLDVSFAVISYLDASEARVSYLDVSIEKVAYLDASEAKISYLDVSRAKVAYLDVSSARVSYLDVSSEKVVYLDASAARIHHLDVSRAKVAYLDASEARIHYLDVSNEWVAYLDASEARVHLLDASNSQVDVLNANKVIIGISGELIWNNALQLNNHPLVYNIMATSMPYLQLNSSLTAVINSYNQILQNLLLAPTMNPPPTPINIVFNTPCGIILNVKDTLDREFRAIIKLPIFVPPYIIEINDLLALINAELQNENMPIYFIFNPVTSVVTLKIPPGYEFWYTDNTNYGEGQRFMNHLGLTSVKNYWIETLTNPYPHRTYYISDVSGAIPTLFPTVVPPIPVKVDKVNPLYDGFIFPTDPAYTILSVGIYYDDISGTFSFYDASGETQQAIPTTNPQNQTFTPKDPNGGSSLSYELAAYTYITEYDETTLSLAIAKFDPPF